MAAFQSIVHDPSQSFQGTVIRIPLRTYEQAKKSKICNSETTVQNIRDVLARFATQFGDSGLLFMKSVGEIKIDSTGGTSTSIGLSDFESVAQWVLFFQEFGTLLKALRNKLMVNNAVKRSLEDRKYNFNHSFEMTIKCKAGHVSRETSFVIHHTICGDSMDTPMQKVSSF